MKKLIFALLTIPFIGLAAVPSWSDIEEITVLKEDLVLPGTAYYRMGECTPQIRIDLDNDGAVEEILLITGEDLWGIEFSKSNDLVKIQERLYLNEEDIEISEFRIKLHDFDSDGIPELIVTIHEEEGMESRGKVFKICGAGVDISRGRVSELNGWLRDVGSFSCVYDDWYAKGNILYSRYVFNTPSYQKMIYTDNKLHSVQEE